MWLLNWLPNWIFYAIGLIGVLTLVVTYFIKFLPIPFVYMYKTPLQLLSIAMIVISTFMAGAIYDNEAWLARVKELEGQVAESEKKAAEKNVEIVEKIVQKDKIIKQKGDDIIKYIDREIVKKEEVIKYIENCPVPKDIIDAHNAAATLNKAAEAKK